MRACSCYADVLHMLHTRLQRRLAIFQGQVGRMMQSKGTGTIRCTPVHLPMGGSRADGDGECCPVPLVKGHAPLLVRGGSLQAPFRAVLTRVVDVIRYNHATFVDLVISGVAGQPPRTRGTHARTHAHTACIRSRGHCSFLGCLSPSKERDPVVI